MPLVARMRVTWIIIPLVLEVKHVGAQEVMGDTMEVAIMPSRLMYSSIKEK